MKKKLSEKLVASVAIPEKGETVIRDTELQGFYVRIMSSGSRLFACAATVRGTGKRRVISLGRYPTLTVVQARQKARIVLAQMLDGIDPVAKEAAEARTVKDACDEFLKRMKTGSLPSQKRAPRPPTMLDATRSCDLICAEFGDTAVAKLTSPDVARLIDNLSEKFQPTSRAKVVAKLKAVLDREVSLGHIRENVASVHKTPPASDSRERVLTEDELRAIWNTGDLPTRLAMLVPARRSILASLEWSHIDEANRLITVPAGMTGNKARMDMILPYGDETQKVLDALPRDTPFVLSGPFCSNASRHAARVRKASKTEGWVLHDLRRVFSTYLSDRAEVLDTDARERLLGHRVGGIAATYDRSTRMVAMRRTQAIWERILTDITSNRETGTVVPLHA